MISLDYYCPIEYRYIPVKYSDFGGIIVFIPILNDTPQSLNFVVFSFYKMNLKNSCSSRLIIVYTLCVKYACYIVSVVLVVRSFWLMIVGIKRNKLEQTLNKTRCIWNLLAQISSCF